MGVGKFLILADKGGGAGLETPILAFIICEQLLSGDIISWIPSYFLVLHGIKWYFKIFRCIDMYFLNFLVFHGIS